jgi:WD40 repeat protein
LWTIDISKDDKYFVTGHSDNSVNVYDLESRELKKEFKKHTDKVSYNIIKGLFS